MDVQSEAQFRHTLLPLLLEVLDQGPASSTVGDLLCLQLLGMTARVLAAVGLEEYVEEVRPACKAARRCCGPARKLPVVAPCLQHKVHPASSTRGNLLRLLLLRMVNVRAGGG